MAEPIKKNLWRDIASNLPGVQSYAVVIAFLLLGQQIAKFANDPGVGWHLADGAQILASGTVPRVDTFLSERRSWISDQWLSDLFLYRVFEIGGWPFLYAVLAVVYMGTFFGVIYPCTRSITKGALSATAATFIAYKMSLIHFILRPVLLSFAIFAPLVMVAFGPLRARLRNDETLGLRIWLGIPLLFLVWAQIHPSFVLGLLVLGLVAAGALFDLVLWSSVASPRAVVQAVLLFALAAAVTLINPYGIELHNSILFLGRSDFFMHLNLEWLPIKFISFEGFLFFVLLAGVAFSSAIGKRYLGWRTFEYFAVVVFAIMAARAARMLPYYAIISVVPIAEGLVWLSTSRWARDGYVVRLIWPILERGGRREALCGRGLIALGVLSIAVLVDSLLVGRVLTFAGPFGPTRDAYPYGAIQKLVVDSQAFQNKPVVITIPNWGGFTVWESRGRLLPQIDDRNTMLGEDAYRSFLDGLQGPERLLSYTRSMRGDYLLLPSEPDVELGPSCEQIYSDSVARVFRVTDSQ